MDRSAAILLCCTLTALILAGCGLFSALQKADQPDTTLSVVTTIYPLTCIAREIGGDRVTVTTLLPAGGSAHLHEVDPATMKQAVEADVLIRIAGGLDEWAQKIFSSAGGDATRVEIAPALHQGREGAPGAMDPHLWLDPLVVRDKVLPLLVQTFGERDPGHSEYYEGNADRFSVTLTELHLELDDLFGGLAGQSFISDHAAWTHFADRYYLEQSGVLEATPGHECGPREAADLIDRARLQNVRVITVTRGHGTMLAEALAAQIDGIIVDLDPLGDPGSTDRSTYVQIMRYNAQRLAAALREAAGP